MNKVLGLALLGVGAYVLYEMFFAQPAPAVATQTTTTGSPSVPVTPVNTTLTVADAATLPYNSAITAAQMSGVSSQLNANIQSGTIPQILGNSVLAFMLGWGAQAANTSKTIFGQTYIFDGTNWNLQPVGTAGMSGYRGVRRIMTRTTRRNYVRRAA